MHEIDFFTEKISLMDHQVVALFIPIIITLGAFFMIIILRSIKHKERMGMIEKGLPVEDLDRMRQESWPGYRHNPYRFAFIMIGAGLGLLLAIFITKIMSGRLDGDEGTGIYFALIGIGAGVGMLAAHKAGQKEE